MCLAFIPLIIATVLSHPLLTHISSRPSSKFTCFSLLSEIMAILVLAFSGLNFTREVTVDYKFKFKCLYCLLYKYKGGRCWVIDDISLPERWTMVSPTQLCCGYHNSPPRQRYMPIALSHRAQAQSLWAQSWRPSCWGTWNPVIMELSTMPAGRYDFCPFVQGWWYVSRIYHHRTRWTSD